MKRIENGWGQLEDFSVFKNATARVFNMYKFCILQINLGVAWSLKYENLENGYLEFIITSKM